MRDILGSDAESLMGLRRHMSSLMISTGAFDDIVEEQEGQEEEEEDHVGDENRSSNRQFLPPPSKGPKLKRCKSASLTWDDCTWTNDFLSAVRHPLDNVVDQVIDENLSSQVIDLLESPRESKFEPLQHHSSNHQQQPLEDSSKRLVRRATFSIFPKELSGDVFRGGEDHQRLRKESGASAEHPQWNSFAPSRGLLNTTRDLENLEPPSPNHESSHKKEETGGRSRPMLRRVNSAELVRRAFPEMLFDRMSPAEDSEHDLSMLDQVVSPGQEFMGVASDDGAESDTERSLNGSENEFHEVHEFNDLNEFSSSSSSSNEGSSSASVSSSSPNDKPVRTASEEEMQYPSPGYAAPGFDMFASHNMQQASGFPMDPAAMMASMGMVPGMDVQQQQQLQHQMMMYMQQMMFVQQQQMMMGGGQPTPFYGQNPSMPMPGAMFTPMMPTSGFTSTTPQQAMHGANMGNRMNQPRSGRRNSESAWASASNGSQSPTPVSSALLAEHKHAGKKPTVAELRNHVLEFAKDSHGSRYLQEVMNSASAEERNVLIEEVKNDCLSVIQDLFGNYVLQNFLEHASDQQRLFIASKMQGVLVNLSMHPHGCRVVQKVFELVPPGETRTELLKELVLAHSAADVDLEHIAKDSHATHVLQKAVMVLQKDVYPYLDSRPGRGSGFHRRGGESRGPVIKGSGEPHLVQVSKTLLKAVEDVVADNVMALAVNQHACRLVQRVLGDCDRSRSPCVSVMMDALETEYDKLAHDQHGNFILQHILEFGQDDQAGRIQDFVSSRAVPLSQHKFGSHLVEKSLITATPQQAQVVIEALLATPSNVLTKLLKDAFANFVMQRAFDVASPEHRARIEHEVTSRSELLSQFPHGRHVLSHLARTKSR